MEQRQIKFRAWDKENKKMCWPTELHWLFEGDRELCHVTVEANRVLDDEEFEVMQFTGVKDQKRKEIYEGDIVFNHSVSRNKAGTVEFSDIHHAYIINYPRTHQDNWGFMHGDEHNLEVVGNIYENKKLLK